MKYNAGIAIRKRAANRNVLSEKKRGWMKEVADKLLAI